MKINSRIVHRGGTLVTAQYFHHSSEVIVILPLILFVAVTKTLE